MLFIFEGISDASTIAPYINELVDECKLSLTVEIMRGDKTSGWIEIGGDVIRGEYEWTTCNIRQELIKRIREHIKSGASIPNLKPRDIYKIYYVTDTDDCFQYPEIPERLNKSKCMKAIFGFDKLKLGPNVEVPIDLIFFARDLEHVTIRNERKLTLEEKNEKAIKFTTEVDKNEGLFEYTFIENELKTWSSFSESYIKIPGYIGRACNMNNLLDEISDFRRKKLEKLTEEIKNISVKLHELKDLTGLKQRKEAEKLNRQLKIKNEEKIKLEEIIEKREKALDNYLKRSFTH